MLKILEAEKFDAVYSLMEESFPPDEHRPYKDQKALLSNPLYRIYVLENGEEITAFMATWNLSDFLFLEHFAVKPAQRNQGLGGELLAELSKIEGKRICLEAEPPETPLAKRRIGFYIRCGFSQNTYPYHQPALSPGLNPVKLQIISSGGALSKEEFEKIKNTLYSEVYHYEEEVEL